MRQTLARLVEEDQPEPDEVTESHGREAEALEKPVGLNDKRLGPVAAALKGGGAQRVPALGGAESKLLKALFAEKQFAEIVRLDVSSHTLEGDAERLRLEQMPQRQREGLRL